MSPIKIFVIDDESYIRVTLADDLKDLGYNVYSYSNPLLALVDIPKLKPEIIFTDIKMPELNGIELLKQIKSKYPEIFVIIMTGFSSVSTALEAVKAGAYDYINKPLVIEDIKILINQIQNLITLSTDYSTLVEQASENYQLNSIIGSSNYTKSLLESIKLIAKSNSTILIEGETGTGKELIANVIHYNSNRKNKPFVKLSCAILSKEIFESELFGHEKGAFTGALKDKKGRFELANKGTLYLDDIDDIPLDLQVKLLRVLEENEFEKVGGENTIKVNVRILASTKKNLKKLINEGKFREDLFYRLNVYPIVLKPLREHTDDIIDLANFFLKQFAPNNTKIFDPNILEIMKNYYWPGNIRELKHLVERLVLISTEKTISIKHLPNEILNSKSIITPYNFESQSLDEYLNNVEKNILIDALNKTSNNKAKAAELLKIPYSTLRTKLDKYSLS